MSLRLSDAGMVGVHHANSVDFVRAAFDVYNSGDVLVVLKQQKPDFPLKQEITPALGGGWFEYHQKVILEDRPAQVVFTSGTEGEPKAILISHRALADVVIRLNEIMRVDESIREYIGIPVTYSFGFGRCRAIAAAGGRGFIPENGFNPVEIANMLAAGEINAISAVPTLWRALLIQSDVIGELGARVKWIEIGSQYMSRAEKEKMKVLFPNAVIVQHYGLTEASRSTLLEISKVTGSLLESVGEALGEVEVRTSEEGRIQIRGPHVAMGRIVKGSLESLVDESGWYTTGDLGHVENGYLFYEGRADDLINCGGVKISPDLLQERLNRRLVAANHLAICKIPDDLRGDGVLVVMEEGADLEAGQILDAAFAELQEMGVNAKSAIKFQKIEKIPRTDTGKVRRKDLAKLYEAAPAVKEKLSDGRYASVADIYSGMFQGAVIRKEDTFRSLGGDSLNYIEMLMLLEKYFGFVPDGWEKKTIHELEGVRKVQPASAWGWLDTGVFLRVIAILAVVATHSGAAAFGGGTLLLFSLIGLNMARFKSKDFMEGKIWPWIGTYSGIIAIPYFLFMAMYLWQNRLFIPGELLLYENLIQARISILFPFWFVQVLLQCLLLVGLIFSVGHLRKWAAKSPYGFSVSILALLMAIRFAYPQFISTAHLNDLIPLRFMAILWLGWTFYFTETWKQKLLIGFVGIIFAFLDTSLLWGFNFQSPETGLAGPTKWLVIGSIFLALVPRVPVPRIMKSVFNDIGSATFYIFIFNGLIIKLFERALPEGSVFLAFMISMFFAMLIWWISEKLNLIAKLQALFRKRSLSVSGA